MDTRFVETFLMAVDNGSIAEAARRLNLTPAAVAKRIRILESEIGTVLFARSGRTIRPTEAGVAIVERSLLPVGTTRMTRMYGPAVRSKEDFDELGVSGLASMYPAFDWSVDSG